MRWCIHWCSTEKMDLWCSLNGDSPESSIQLELEPLDHDSIFRPMVRDPRFEGRFRSYEVWITRALKHLANPQADVEDNDWVVPRQSRQRSGDGGGGWGSGYLPLLIMSINKEFNHQQWGMTRMTWFQLRIYHQNPEMLVGCFMLVNIWGCRTLAGWLGGKF